MQAWRLRRGWIVAVTVTAALGLAPAVATAQDSGNLDELTQGFDDGFGGGDLDAGFEDDLTAGLETEAPSEPSFWDLGGFVRGDSSYNVAREREGPGDADYRGLNKLRLTLRLELDLELPGSWEAFVSGQSAYDGAYELKDRENYTDEVLDAYEEETEFREVYVQGGLLPGVDLKLGRQIVVWGKSDYIRVVDVLNPVDNREPGLTDLEDLRLPVTASRLDWSGGPWTATAVAIHEVRFNKDPVIGAEFYPYDFSVPEEEPSDGGENTEYGASLRGFFSGWDLGLYWAQVFDDEGRIGTTGSGANTSLVRLHDRLTIGGAAGTVAAGSWLYKAELALVQGLQFANDPGTDYNRVDALVGTEYSGFTNTTLGVELADRHLLDFTEELEASPDNAAEDQNQYVLSYRRTFLRELLTANVVAMFFGQNADEGSLQRYAMDYDWFPAFNVGGGVVIYQSGGEQNFLLDAAQNNDRVYGEVKWSF